jgi:hypothetical protein
LDDERYRILVKEKGKTMKTTKGRRQLINDALASGMTVRERDGRCDISTGKTYRSVGITIWEDGVATRNDVEPSSCLSIRTIKQMRGILGL